VAAAVLGMVSAVLAQSTAEELPPVAGEPAYVDPLHQERPAGVPDDATLEAAGAIIGEIELHVYDIFDLDDPEENKRLFRWANKLHINTKQRTVRNQLLFKEGDPYSARVLAETERVLRTTEYLYDARILPVAYEGNRVRVRVVTRDVWTLRPGLSLSRSGGENEFRIALNDANFLGWGKDITFRYSDTVDRTSYLYRYRDPNLAGTRWRLQAAYQDNSDGDQQLLDIERPFFSLDTRWSTAARALSFDRVDTLYTLGEIRERFQHVEDVYEAGAAFSRGYARGGTRRWAAGLTYEEHRFGPADGFAPSPEQPEDRLLVYPWMEFSSIREDYAKLRNLDQIARTEDLNFGREFAVRLGWCSEQFGADRDQAILFSSFRAGYVPMRDQLLLVRSYLSGRWGSGDPENLLLGAAARWDIPTLGRHRFHVFVGVDVADNLDGERQLLLGGDSGLRGYPLRYQEGDRRYLLTLEQRFYTSWHPFQLVNVGAAVFFDLGEAWFAGSRGDATELGVLRDLGFGLRLASSRSAEGSMVHIDLAFPLDGDDSIDRVQFLVEAHDSF